MSSFEEARQAKFERGAREHGQPWDAAHIDAVAEARDEFLDLANYVTLIPGPVGRDLYKVALIFWRELPKRDAAR
jgi:hypothetical protein